MGMLMGGRGARPIGTMPKIAQGVPIQSSAYGVSVPIIYGTNRFAGNLIWYGDFLALTSFVPSASVGKGFGGGGNIAPPGSTTNYYASFAWGLCEGPIAGIGKVWIGNGVYTVSEVGLSLFLGTRPTQSPWGYLTSNHPGQDLGYEGLAYVAVSAYYMGTSASMPNFSYEVQGLLLVGGGNADADPSAMLADFLTNTEYGVGLLPIQLDNGGTGGAPAAGSWLAYQAYCFAASLFLSPVLDQQTDAVSILNEWLQYTLTGAIWSEGKLKLIPYGDTALTGNGKTYTPAVTPLYTLTDDDFLHDSSSTDDPVQVTRQTPADAFNRVRVQYYDRTNNYMPGIVEAVDQLSVGLYGSRVQNTYDAREICTLATAQSVAQLLLQRQAYLRNSYVFKLDARYVLLEPMDVIALTDSRLGLSAWPVRITQVEEDEHYELTVTAQDLLVGLGQTPGYPSQTPGGYQSNYNLSPGNPNPPLFVCAPPDLTAGNLEVWIAVSGGPNWGGCYVYVSLDGTSYTQVGKMSGQSRMGVTTTSLPAAGDPDTADTLGVDLTESQGQLISGSHQDADLFHTLCALDMGAAQEFISYETATLISGYKYNLTTYLRRGGFGSPIGAHGVGVPFARLDERVFRLQYSSLHIGQLLYVKLQGFNLYGQALQDLSTVTAYQYTIVGPPLTGIPTGFNAQQFGGTVQFKWDAGDTWAAQGFELRYGTQGQATWATATPLVRALKGTSHANASVPPGSWTFFLAGINQAGQESQAATASLTVTAVAGLLLSTPQAPDFAADTLTGFIHHYTGVLVPDDQHTAAYYTDWSVFDKYVPTPVAVCTCDAPEINNGFVNAFSAWADILWEQGPGESGTPTLQIYIDYAGANHVYTGTWHLWNGGQISAQYVKFRLSQTPGADPVYISQFTPRLNDSQITDSGASMAVAAAGTPITFSKTFHIAPSVTVTAVGAALIGVATNVTATGCTLMLYNTAGTAVAGTANWAAVGF